MVDIVSIGYEINAKGLEKANKEVDALHAKIDKLGKTKHVDTMSGTNTKQQIAGIDATTKALEKQVLIGQYLGKGYDRSTANSIASFKMLGASVDQTNSQLNQLVQNKGLVKQQQDALALSKAQQKVVDQQRASIALQEKQIILARGASKYRQEGFTSTNATKLSTFELSGASVSNMDAYKKALMDAQGGLKQFGVVAEDTGKRVGFLNTEVGGIAKYAVLSAVIYGLMTATVGLAVATVQMADEYTAIQNRMKLYIKDANELISVNKQLAQFSVENNVGLRETSTLFARLAPSMQRLGKNTSDITTVVDSFGKSMRIGGATAMEAASATTQFSQAMASGKLAGDEFRSISEASPRFLKAIADGSGIAADKLKEMSSAGKLTTEVISKALIKEYAKLNSENSKLGITLEQGTNAIKTMFTVMVGEFNEGAGITKFLGESMVGLASSMQETANGAKATGQVLNKWFTDNSANIEAVAKIATVVASVMVGKLVSSVVLASVAMVRAKISAIAFNIGLLTLSTTTTTLAQKMNVLGVAVRGVYTALGGWVGILATVATVAVGMEAFKTKTAEANEEIISQNKYVNLATEELKALGEEQKKLAGIKLKLDMSEAERNISSSKNEVLKSFDDIIYKWDFLKKSTDNGFVEKYDDIIKSVKSGNIPFDEAIQKLLEMGAITDEYASELSKLTTNYDKTVESSKPLLKAMTALGIQHKVTSEASANGSSAGQLYTQVLTELSKEADVASSSFGKLSSKFKEASDLIKGGLNVGKITGLRDQQINEDIYKGAKEQADKLKGTVGVLKDVSEVTADSLIKGGTFDSDISDAKELLAIRSQAEKFYEKASTKEADNRAKTRDGIREQIESTSMLQNLLSKGASYDVSKIASQKEYMKAFADTNVAIDLVASQQRAKQIEYEQGLVSQRDVQIEMLQLLNKGVDVENARNIASLNYTNSVSQRKIAEEAVTNSLVEQSITLASSLRDQDNLNVLLLKGLSIEEAQLHYSFTKLAKIRDQNNELSESQQIMYENMVLDTKNLEVKKAQGELVKANNDLQLKASLLAKTQNNELVGVMLQYKGITAEQAKSLVISDNIAKKLSEYNDAMREQASLTYDLNNVNFDAFGDFGNPFESALNGLNDMIFGAQQLKVAYEESASVLDARMADAIMKGEDYSNLEQQRASLGLNYELEKEKAQKRSINTALSLTKSMFKEETRGYKAITALERAYQASQVAFALWEKKDTITMLALKLKSHVMDALGFTTSATTKVASQGAVNLAKGTEAVLSQGSGDPYSAFARMASMAAIVAGLGVAISGGFGGGGDSGYVEPSNDGTGTVFGDSSAQSKSIKNSIDILADNSDLMLPINDAMLRSLRNIESAIGGVANLLIRGDFGTDIAQGFGFDAQLTGNLSKIHDFASKSTLLFTGFTDKLTGLAGGEMLNGLVGSVLGGLFGKTSQEVTATGISGWAQSLGSILEDGFALNSFADVKTTKKSWFSKKTSYSTVFGEVDNEIKNQFQLIFANVYDSILSASSVLGRDENDVMSKLRDTIVNIGKIQTSGLSGEAIQEQLEAIIGQQSDLIAKGAVGGLDKFQKIGEGYYETLVRVASGIEQADYFLDRLGYTAINYSDILYKQGDVGAELVRQSVLLNEHTKDITGGFYDLVNTFDGTAEELTSFIFTLRDLQEMLEMTGKNVDYLTSSMILGAGGLDKLNSGFDAYYEMLSPAEQASELARRLTKDFEFLNLTLPDGTKGFRDLINSIDVTTLEGQKLYGQVIALAPEFNDLQDSLESANSAVNSLVQSLRDLANEAKKARGETDQNRNLEATRYAYQQNAVLAMQGDTDAAQKLLDLGKNLMTLSKTYSVTASEYARDLALIQQSATVSADVQEAGLGFTNDSLTPVASVGGTPALETNSTGTDAKLDDLTEKLEAYLLAITKNTQPLARLDDWDDGGRMTVRVEQDTVNDAIPVKVL